MKTAPYTAILLIALVFAAQGMEAQTRERREIERKDTQRSGNTNVRRQEPQRSTTVKRQVRQEPAQRRPEVTRSRKPVSISTPHNPRSDYKKPGTRVYADGRAPVRRKPNKYTSERYYSGHHYHYVYPAKKVRFNYHFDTHVHNYRVLYYPASTHIVWTRSMYRDYRRWYPDYRWRYDYGYRIRTLSAFEARYSLGEVAMVYGRVYATWHNRETDDYLLFFGGDYPRHQFTIVLPGDVARRFSWRPERYFLGEHVTVTGLITTFDGIPEIIVKNRRQIGLY